jgi:hypothetical protein
VIFRAFEKITRSSDAKSKGRAVDKKVAEMQKFEQREQFSVLSAQF